MANSLTGPVWTVDTAATLTTGRVKLAGVRWVGATAAQHVAVITDGAGRRVWSSEASGSSYVEADDRMASALVTGLIVTTLDSGVLELEFN